MSNGFPISRSFEGTYENTLRQETISLSSMFKGFPSKIQFKDAHANTLKQETISVQSTSKKILSKGNLSMHMKTHSDDKPYVSNQQ